MRYPGAAAPSQFAMLKLLLAVTLVFLAALGLLVFSPLLVMYGALHDIPQLLSLSAPAHVLALALVTVTVPLAGALGLAGITLDSLSGLLVTRKRKRKSGAMPTARARFLASLSRRERSILRQKLAAARLTIREDGVLIPQAGVSAHESSCKLHKRISILPKDSSAR